MWPWGHAAVGYLVYSLSVRATGRRPGDLPVLALALGTQFPDLVDKPLGWTLGVLPGGRSLAHSLLTVAVIGLFLGVLVRRYGRREMAVAFLVGYVTHLLSDGLYAVIGGEYAKLTYLLWPVLPMPTYETAPTFAAHLAEFELSGTVTLGLSVVAFTVTLWWLDGRPGLRPIRAAGTAWLDQFTNPE